MLAINCNDTQTRGKNKKSQDKTSDRGRVFTKMAEVPESE